ncbi:hypothetical protein PNA2_1722 [Pyrococcus sp. NA2]|nr:hypothetical protein PNA2_1722 [Pyrococcus sp. NA2]
MRKKLFSLILGLLIFKTALGMVSASSGVQNYLNATVFDRAELELMQKERFDPKVQQYYRIIKLMELNGIDTRDFLLMLEKRIRETHEFMIIDKAIALAKQYYQEKTGKRINDNALNVLREEEFIRPMSSTEIDEIYDIYDPSMKIYVQTLTKLKFDILDAQYVGMATYVRIKGDYVGKPTPKGNGIIPEHYDYTWISYHSPEDEKNWVLSDLNQKYGITEDMVELIHIKYFVNAKAKKAYYEGQTVGINMGTIVLPITPTRVKAQYPNSHTYEYAWIELWSEANYYPDLGTWKNCRVS